MIRLLIKREQTPLHGYFLTRPTFRDDQCQGQSKASFSKIDNKFDDKIEKLVFPSSFDDEYDRGKINEFES